MDMLCSSVNMNDILRKMFSLIAVKIETVTKFSSHDTDEEAHSACA